MSVLIDLDERGPLMLGGPFERLFEVFRVGVNRSGDKRPFAADGDRQRMQGIIDGTHRCALGCLAQRRRR